MSYLEKDTQKQLNQELKVLNKVDHPNILKHLGFYKDEKYLYIVYENFEG